jgi:hypothetical protein
MKRTLLVLLAFMVSPALLADAPTKDPNWKTIAALGDTIKGVEVISGNELRIAKIHCRLLGIRIPAEQAEHAKRFLELYLKDYGSGLCIYNAHWPINDKDGVPLIWLKGMGNGGWAQETLVEAGLATMDHRGYEGYKFNVPRKQPGNDDVDWKKCLLDAEATFSQGKKPNVNFKWPEPK